MGMLVEFADKNASFNDELYTTALDRANDLQEEESTGEQLDADIEANTTTIVATSVGIGVTAAIVVIAVW